MVRGLDRRRRSARVVVSVFALSTIPRIASAQERQETRTDSNEPSPAPYNPRLHEESPESPPPSPRSVPSGPRTHLIVDLPERVELAERSGQGDWVAICKGKCDVVVSATDGADRKVVDGTRSWPLQLPSDGARIVRVTLDEPHTAVRVTSVTMLVAAGVLVGVGLYRLVANPPEVDLTFAPGLSRCDHTDYKECEAARAEEERARDARNEERSDERTAGLIMMGIGAGVAIIGGILAVTSLRKPEVRVQRIANATGIRLTF
jgi:hypothetical protein